MTAEEVKNLLIQIARRIEEHKQELTDLDAAIGDGDHGINMAKGFREVVKKLETMPDGYSPADVFKNTAMALISHVGGASGPLYGTLFMKGAAAVISVPEMQMADFLSFLKEGIAGVKMRGKSEAGEKTMLDVLIPVANCLEECLVQQKLPEEIWQKLLAAAEEGVAYTKTIKATKGRASYVGDRSIGHVDPGAMSSYIMLKEVAAFAQNC